MHYRSFVFVSCVVVLLLSSFSFAQEATPGYEDSWGKQQRVQEMLDYWRSWEMSGPDTNISAARQLGMKQFLSMKRPPAFKQSAQSIPAWEYAATSQFAGKQAVSGRTTDVAFDPSDELNVLYLAASGGGLWKTTNANASDQSQIKWVPVSNSFGSYAMGAVAVHPLTPDVVFAATGDLHGGDGDGLYKSTDAGLNWVKIAPHTGATGISNKSNQLLFNPLNPQHMYHTSTSAIRKSYDGGYTWDNVQNIGSASAATHMVIDPTDTNRLYVAGGGKIIRSTDGGATWSTDRAASITGKGRITLGFSPADPSKVYASIVRGNTGTSIGSAVSTDYGDTWKIVDDQDYTGEQGFYNNSCVASPTKPNLMFVAGLDIYRSTTSGTGLSKRSNWLAKNGADNYTHADVHVLKYSPSGSKLYALTDGGLFVSGDEGLKWSSLNNDLGTLQFVGADAAPDMSYVIGGCQDNGNNRAEAGQRVFQETDGGDGGRTFVVQNDPTIVYSTYYGASLKRSNNAGREESWVSIVRPADGSALGNEGTPFYMQYDVSESDGAYMAVVGIRNVYYSTDGGFTLARITPTSIGPKAVHVTAGDPSYLYVGTAGGYVYTTPDGGETWVKSTTRVGSSDFGQNIFANFVSDPANHLKAWTVTAGFGGQKFWRTEDGGLNWTAPATNLPNLSMQTIARAPNGDLFIGHAFGVMRSIDNGVTWEPLRDGLPLCDVRKLQVRNGYLIAATYGRSIWKININELPRTIEVSVKHAEDPNFQIASIMPNPVRSTVDMNYKISADSKVMIRLYDELGREVKLLANEFNSAGEHTLRTNLSDVPSGSYSVVLTAGGKAITERLVITH